MFPSRIPKTSVTLAGLLLAVASPLFAADSMAPSVQEAEAAPSAQPASDTQAQRNLIVRQLVAQGRSHDQAQHMVNALTAEDVRVLAQNHNMLDSAGNSTVIAWAVLLAIIIAGATAVIIANST